MREGEIGNGARETENQVAKALQAIVYACDLNQKEMVNSPVIFE